MTFTMTFIKQVTMMVSLFLLLVSPTSRYLIMTCLTDARFWDVFFTYALPAYMFIVRHFRYRRVDKIKKIYGFSDDFESYRNMTPDVAQVVLKNLAEFDFPFTFEFGWISEFFKVRADFWAYGSSPPHLHPSAFGCPRLSCKLIWNSPRSLRTPLPLFPQHLALARLPFPIQDWAISCMLLIDDAHMSSIEIRDQSITRGIALIDPPLTSPSFSFELAHTELRIERMHIPESLAHALGYPIVDQSKLC